MSFAVGAARECAPLANGDRVSAARITPLLLAHSGHDTHQRHRFHRHHRRSRFAHARRPTKLSLPCAAASSGRHAATQLLSPVYPPAYGLG